MSADVTTLPAGRPDPRRWFAVAAVVALIVAVGVAVVVRSAGDENNPSFAGEPLEWTTHELELATAEDLSSQMGGFGLPETQPGDDDITWLAGMNELPGRPVDIAVDQESGDVWALVLVAPEGTNLLYRREASGAVTGYDLGGRWVPDPAGHLESAGDRLAVALDGRLLLIDPASGEYREAHLQRPRRQDDLSANPFVAGMHVVDDSLFLNWGLSLAVVEVSLTEDEARTISVPGSFGAIDQVVVSEGYIWLMQTADHTAGEKAHIGWLDRESGELLGTAALKPYTAAVDGDELVVPAWGPFGLYRVTARGFTEVGADAKTTEYVESRMGPAALALVDEERDVVWIVNPTAGAALRVDMVRGESEEYALPVYEVDATYRSCPQVLPGDPPCPETYTQFTDVRAVALSESGDLFFADATAFRVGMIPAQ